MGGCFSSGTDVKDAEPEEVSPLADALFTDQAGQWRALLVQKHLAANDRQAVFASCHQGRELIAKHSLHARFQLTPHKKVVAAVREVLVLRGQVLQEAATTQLSISTLPFPRDMTPVGMLVELEHVGKGVTDVVIESGGLSKGMGPPLQAAFHNLVRLEAHITASNGLQELLAAQLPRLTSIHLRVSSLEVTYPAVTAQVSALISEFWDQCSSWMVTVDEALPPMPAIIVPKRLTTQLTILALPVVLDDAVLQTLLDCAPALSEVYIVSLQLARDHSSRTCPWSTLWVHDLCLESQSIARLPTPTRKGATLSAYEGTWTLKQGSAQALGLRHGVSLDSNHHASSRALARHSLDATPALAALRSRAVRGVDVHAGRVHACITQPSRASLDGLPSRSLRLHSRYSRPLQSTSLPAASHACTVNCHGPMAGTRPAVCRSSLGSVAGCSSGSGTCEDVAVFSHTLSLSSHTLSVPGQCLEPQRVSLGYAGEPAPQPQTTHRYSAHDSLGYAGEPAVQCSAQATGPLPTCSVHPHARSGTVPTSGLGYAGEPAVQGSSKAQGPSAGETGPVQGSTQLGSVHPRAGVMNVATAEAPFSTQHSTQHSTNLGTQLGPGMVQTDSCTPASRRALGPTATCTVHPPADHNTIATAQAPVQASISMQSSMESNKSSSVGGAGLAGPSMTAGKRRPRRPRRAPGHWDLHLGVLQVHAACGGDAGLEVGELRVALECLACVCPRAWSNVKEGMQIALYDFHITHELIQLLPSFPAGGVAKLSGRWSVEEAPAYATLLHHLPSSLRRVSISEASGKPIPRVIADCICSANADTSLLERAATDPPLVVHLRGVEPPPPAKHPPFPPRTPTLAPPTSPQAPATPAEPYQPREIRVVPLTSGRRRPPRWPPAGTQPASGKAVTPPVSPSHDRQAVPITLDTTQSDRTQPEPAVQIQGETGGRDTAGTGVGRAEAGTAAGPGQQKCVAGTQPEPAVQVQSTTGVERPASTGRARQDATPTTVAQGQDKAAVVGCLVSPFSAQACGVPAKASAHAPLNVSTPDVPTPTPTAGSHHTAGSHTCGVPAKASAHAPNVVDTFVSTSQAPAGSHHTAGSHTCGVHARAPAHAPSVGTNTFVSTNQAPAGLHDAAGSDHARELHESAGSSEGAGSHEAASGVHNARGPHGAAGSHEGTSSSEGAASSTARSSLTTNDTSVSSSNRHTTDTTTNSENSSPDISTTPSKPRPPTPPPLVLPTSEQTATDPGNEAGTSRLLTNGYSWWDDTNHAKGSLVVSRPHEWIVYDDGGRTARAGSYPLSVATGNRNVSSAVSFILDEYQSVDDLY